MIKEITKKFSELTKDLSKAAKIEYMQQFGFNSWPEITNSPNDKLKWLSERLDKEAPMVVRKFNNYEVWYPNGNKSVKNVRWSHPYVMNHWNKKIEDVKKVDIFGNEVSDDL